MEFMTVIHTRARKVEGWQALATSMPDQAHEQVPPDRGDRRSSWLTSNVAPPV